MGRGLISLGLLAVVHVTSATWVSGSVSTASWVNAVNRKRCRHNGYHNGAPVEWSWYLYQKAKDAAEANSICSSSDVSFIYLQNSTRDTNPLNTSQSYSGFSFHIEPGVSGRDTATKVVNGWYSEGLAECSGASGSGLVLPGCIDDPNSTGNSQSDSATADGIEYVFMGMISSATRYVGCYRCSEGASDSTSASFNSLRVICSFKGESDSCPDATDCSTCHDWEEVSCHTSRILGLNSSQTDGDCTVEVESFVVSAIASNATATDDPFMTTEAIIITTVAAIVFVVILLVLVRNWEWIRVHVFGMHSRKYISNKKSAQKANAASIRTTMRSVKEVQSKRVGSSIRHPATDEIFNPKFTQQESGMAGKSVSALDQIDKRFDPKSRKPLTEDPSGLTRRNRGARRPPSDPNIGEASF